MINEKTGAKETFEAEVPLWGGVSGPIFFWLVRRDSTGLFCRCNTSQGRQRAKINLKYRKKMK